MILVKMRTERDCFSCCVATILGYRYEDVPVFFDYEDKDPYIGWTAFGKWLEGRSMWPLLKIIHRTRLLEPENILEGAHILLGTAVGRIDADESHAVVCVLGAQYDPRVGGKGVGPFADGTMTAVIICHGDVNA